MRRIATKLLALVLVVCTLVSLTAIAAVSVSAAGNDVTIDLITDEKSKTNLYGLDKEGQKKNDFSVKNVSDLAAGEIEYKGSSTTAYYAGMKNAEKRDGMGIYLGSDIDVSSVTDGREGRYKVDTWVWLEDTSKMDEDFVFRVYESNTYNTFAKVEKKDNCGEYRLINHSFKVETLKNGWNHLVFTLPEFGRTSNAFEEEAFNNFRKGENKKTICAVAFLNYGESVGDFAVASLRITTEKKIKADYPEEFPAEEGDQNDLSGGDEVESVVLLDKIASQQIKTYINSFKMGNAIDLSKYNDECIQKVITAAADEGLEIIKNTAGKYCVKGSEKDDVNGSVDLTLIIIIAAAVVVVIAVVVVLIIVLGKKKKAAAAAAVPAVEAKTEEEEEAEEE